MTDQHTEFTDAEIHAYVDGQLDHERAKVLVKCLQTDSKLAKQVADYQLLNANLRNLLDPVQREPVPEELLREIDPQDLLDEREDLQEVSPSIPTIKPSIDTSEEPHKKQYWMSIAQAAMLAGLMLVSGFTGWLVKENDNNETFAQLQTDLVQPATFAHTVYANDSQRPVEIKVENEGQLIKWLSTRLKTNITAPSLTDQGFHLLGGRLIPSTNRMAAQFMYQDKSGIRVSLYVRRGTWDRENMPMRYEQENGLAAFTWIDDSMGYALSGDIQKMDLLALAETAHRVN